MTTNLNTQAVQALPNARVWNKDTMSRTYLDALPILNPGLVVNYYNGSGNIQSAKLNGNHLSNGQARRLLDQARNTKIWIENSTGELKATGTNSSLEDIAAAITNLLNN